MENKELTRKKRGKGNKHKNNDELQQEDPEDKINTNRDIAEEEVKAPEPIPIMDDRERENLIRRNMEGEGINRHVTLATAIPNGVKTLRFAGVLLFWINFLYISTAFSFFTLFWQSLDSDGIMIGQYTSVINKIFSPLSFFMNIFTFILIRNYIKSVLFVWKYLILTFAALMGVFSIICVYSIGNIDNTKLETNWSSFSGTEKYYFKDSIEEYKSFMRKSETFVSFYLLLESVLIAILGLISWYFQISLPDNFIPEYKSRRPFYPSGIVYDKDVSSINEMKYESEQSMLRSLRNRT